MKLAVTHKATIENYDGLKKGDAECSHEAEKDVGISRNLGFYVLIGAIFWGIIFSTFAMAP